jgi:hypothetical protein
MYHLHLSFIAQEKKNVYKKTVRSGESLSMKAIKTAYWSNMEYAETIMPRGALRTHLLRFIAGF